MEQWIEEFLYRGRPPSGADSDKAPAFHVVIGQQVDSPFDAEQKQRRVIGPVSLEAAEQAGWTFDEIIAEMNADAIKRCDELDADCKAKEAEIEALTKRATDAEKTAETLTQENAELRQVCADVAEQLEAQRAAMAAAQAEAPHETSEAP